MIDPTVQIALITVLGATLSPTILAWQINRSRRQERESDYARQDEVARASREAAAKAEASAHALVMNTASVAEGVKITNEKLVEVANTTQVIHTLVNSTLTAQMQSALDAQVALLAALKEIVRLGRTAGGEPSTDTLAEIEATEIKIADLKISLADRLKQATVVTEQQREQKLAGQTP